MKKKILLALLLCFTIILTGCSNPKIEGSKIKTELKVNGYPNAKEFVEGFPYNDENPFGEYYSVIKGEKENENAVKTRYIKIGNKSFELTYEKSQEWALSAYDVYSLKDNEDIKIYYHLNTDIVYRFASEGSSLSKIFPYEDHTMDSEESLRSYSESIAKLVDFDLSGLTYKPYTSGEEKDGTLFRTDEYIESRYGEKSIQSRGCKWIKTYDNGKSLLAFQVLFSYRNGNFIVDSITFAPFPDKIFTLSDEDAIELATGHSDNNTLEITDVAYIIVANNKICVRVSYQYSVPFDGSFYIVSTEEYLFPSDVTFP